MKLLLLVLFVKYLFAFRMAISNWATAFSEIQDMKMN
jgi:hypothetical protein